MSEQHLTVSEIVERQAQWLRDNADTGCAVLSKEQWEAVQQALKALEIVLDERKDYDECMTAAGDALTELRELGLLEETE